MRLRQPNLFNKRFLWIFTQFVFLTSITSLYAQDTVTGAFEGIISNSQTGIPLAGATVAIINQQGGEPIIKTTDSKGRFYQGLLAPGLYTIRVSIKGYQTRQHVQRIRVSRTGDVVPVPVALDPEIPGITPPGPGAGAPAGGEDGDIRAEIITTDARRSGSFSEVDVSTLPVGSSTLVRTFDELALLLRE